MWRAACMHVSMILSCRRSCTVTLRAARSLTHHMPRDVGEGLLLPASASDLSRTLSQSAGRTELSHRHRHSHIYSRPDTQQTSGIDTRDMVVHMARETKTRTRT